MQNITDLLNSVKNININDYLYHILALAGLLILLIFAWGAVKNLIRKKRYSSVQALKKMKWQDFETLCFDVFKRNGYRTEKFGGTKDGGIDLLIHNSEEKAIVQCKKYAGNVSVKTVREMLGLVYHYKVDRVIIVTTADFTAEAVVFAKNHPLTLINGNELAGIIAGKRKIKKCTAARKIR